MSDGSSSICGRASEEFLIIGVVSECRIPLSLEKAG